MACDSGRWRTVAFVPAVQAPKSASMPAISLGDSLVDGILHPCRVQGVVTVHEHVPQPDEFAGVGHLVKHCRL
jgi:hypothetical protein